MPSGAKLIIATIEKNNGKAYVVGGCVRDAVLGNAPNDWDICTNLTPDEIKSLFPRVLPIGEQHGTVGVKLKKELYEVTTFRTDGAYKDGRHPENIQFIDNLYEDLKRRDFTMNAIAYHPVEGLVDPFGGAKDLKEKQICAVGDAGVRFKEDYLRILRLFRFQAKLGFSIEENTFYSAGHEKDGLSCIAKERVGTEMRKLLSAKYPAVALTGMLKSGVLFSILPLRWTESMDFSVIDRISSTGEDRLAVLLYLGKGEKTVDEVVEIARHSFCLSNKEQNNVRQLLFKLQESPEIDKVKKCLFEMGSALSLDYANVRVELEQSKRATTFLEEMKRVLESGECFTFPIALSGKELEEQGIPRGPQIGQCLQELLEWIWEDNTRNQREILLKEVNKRWGN